METPDSVERMLERRLVPVGFSDEGMNRLEAMVDELAGEPTKRSSPHRLKIMSAAAACLGAGWLVISSLMPEDRSPLVAVPEWSDSVEDVTLIENSHGVVAAEREAWLVADEDGSLHRAWQVRVVSEEHFRDERSGQMVRVVHPRDELVLMPVTSF